LLQKTFPAQQRYKYTAYIVWELGNIFLEVYML